MPPSRSLLRATVEAYLAHHPGERAGLGPLLRALDGPADPTGRTTLPGRVTCSALLVDGLGRVLHLRHPASSTPLPPGGDVEPGDPTLSATALRELRAHAGVPPQAVAPWPGHDGVPLHIAVHGVDAGQARPRPARHHYDLCFPFRLVDDAAAVPPRAWQAAAGEWRPLDRTASPALCEKLLTLTPSPPAYRHAHASALIHDGAGRYLLHLRDDRPDIREPGAWSLPGGGREPQDRSLEETVRRELREEAGLHLADLVPFAVEETHGSAGAPVPLAVYAGRWNGDPAALTLTEGVMLAWFAPDVLPRLRASRTTRDLVYRHAAGTRASAPSGTSMGAASHGSGPLLPGRRTGSAPQGTVPHIVGVHLYLEDAEGRLLLGRRHPGSAYAPSMHHFLAGHCERESAVSCLVREAWEEAGLVLDPRAVELVHVVHLVDGPGHTPRMQLVFRARSWSGTPRVREPDTCTGWRFWHPDALPEQLVPYARAAVEGIRAGRLFTESGWG